MGNKFLLLLLSVLGFGSSKENGGSSVELYGSPSTEFTIKGYVTDAQGKLIQGIRVTPVSFKIASSDYVFEFQKPPYALTDKSGFYTVRNGVGVFGKPFDVQLRFEDIDGEENGGLFSTKQSDIPFTQENLTEKGSWVSRYEKKADDTRLEKAKE